MAISLNTSNRLTGAGTGPLQSSLPGSEVASRAVSQAPGRVEGADGLRDVLRRPAEALANQLQRNEVRLSAIGRLRGAIAGVAETAAGLRREAQPSADDALQQVVRRFVDAVNAEVRVASEVVFNRPGGGRPAVLGDDGRIRLAAIELRRGVDEPSRNGGVSLRSVGLQREADGTLSFDPAAFDQALAADRDAVSRSLDRFGQQVAATANGQLAPGANLGRTGRSLEDQLADLRERAAIQQQAADTRDENPLANLRVPNNPFLVAGVQAYRGVFNL